MADLIRYREQLREDDDRFGRFRLIGWWDQERLAAARVLVIGAGALGNEILKNLALLGVGRIFVADLDRVENSNLSRCILFRESDNGRLKAEVAAGAVKDILPGAKVRAFSGDVVHELGLGIYRWAHIVIAGLDNREARLHVNRSAWRAGVPWVDGAIEQLNGVMRFFQPPAGSCYECTMNQTDWDMLERRRACSLLTRDEMLEGKVPTTPTTASIVAGLECQEAVKYLHGLEVMAGKGLVYNGLSHDSYVVEYPRREECYSHETWAEVEPLHHGAADLSARMLLERARKDLGPDAVLELNRDLLVALACSGCGAREERFMALGKVKESEARCATCHEQRQPETVHVLSGEEPFLDRPLADIGVPRWDVLTGRAGMEEKHYELAGDASSVLGELHEAAAAR
jgi:adenylyltransferase/sulfurtransferase